MAENSLKLRVIFVGIGGATCSGKTTLAKHLRNILPGGIILHQDDFAPPQELIPIHPVYNVQDWDDPEGAIDWPRMVQSLGKMKETGVVPTEHYSHDHLNEQRDVPVDPTVTNKWREIFTKMQEERQKAGERIVWVIIDGFLMYWNQEVIDSLDIRAFIRVPEAILKQRRHERHGYHTAVQSDPEGTLWRDPPNYWEQIVWPAYVKAHSSMLEGEDMDTAKPSGKVKDLVLIEGVKQSMGKMVEVVCEQMVKTVQST